jgi:TQXA domain-containing protein
MEEHMHQSTFAFGVASQTLWRGMRHVFMLAAVLFGVSLSARPAVAADATLTGVGPGLSVTGRIEGGSADISNFAGVLHITIDGGPESDAYCVDIQFHISIGDTEPQVPPDYPCQVVYILNNAFPHANEIGSRLPDDNREAAAVQAAIWHFTDAFTVTAPLDVASRTAVITAAAQSQCEQVALVPQSLTLSPSLATNYLPDDTSHTVTATLLATDGDVVPGYPIDIVVIGAAGPQTFHGVTDDTGLFTVSYENTFAVTGTDTITGSASFTVPVGLKFKLEGRQGIALAGQPRNGSVTGTATKHWVPARCGDGVVNQIGEECDDGNAVDGDGCDTNCTPTRCGNGIVTGGEECDDGNLLDGDGCDANCTPTGCGNGIVTVGEECDDGNSVNGDQCDTNCTRPRCGNGIVTVGEECDDGNSVNGDQCDTNCTWPRCGNGILDPHEQCDDGNLLDGDGCDANCTPTGCGNGIVTAGEACDDGNVVSGDGCDANCTPTGCGNGIVTAGEQCDDGNRVNGDACDNNCTAPRCGNGIVTAGEACDDGNAVSGDGCDANCTPTGCGNGIVTAGEACDDGNAVSGDGCDANCMPTGCGNGIVTAGEECDDGNVVSGDGCDANCTPTGCGNGVVTAGEECDDGNGIDGDECEGDCTLPRCGNGILDSGEQCDDGNVADGDGCSATCRLQEICLDLVDNDGNGLIDCDDPACSCLPIEKDPATIWFRSGKLGVLGLHGRLVPQTPIDPIAEGLGIIVTNTNGVVFRGSLMPGDLKRVQKDHFTLGDRAAVAADGRRGGIQRIVLSKAGARYRLTLRAFGNLDAATVPVMMVQIVIGDDAFFSKGEWRRTRRGWMLGF